MITTTPPIAATVFDRTALLGALPHVLFPLFPTADELATGLAGPMGCKYLMRTNQLVFVERNSNRIGRLDLIAPAGPVVSTGTTTLPGGSTFDCDTGTVNPAPATNRADVRWETPSAGVRRMTPAGGARIANLGIHDYHAVTSDALQMLAFDALPIDSDPTGWNGLPSNAVFAVHTNAGNYCKVKIVAYGQDLQIAWTTYSVGSRLTYIGRNYDELFDIIVDADGVNAYAIESDGSIVHVDLTHADYAPANEWLTAGLNTPQQAQFSSAGDAIYVVEGTPSGRLLKINRSTKAITTIASGLENAVGLVLSDGDGFAYVSERGASGGRVRRISLPAGTISTIATGFTQPAMMTWSDPSRARIVLCEGVSANRLTVIDLSNNSFTSPVTGLDPGPVAVAMIGGGRALVTTNTTIDEVQLVGTHVLSGPDFKGIGDVPIDHVTAAGLADTHDAPAPIPQFVNTPFGGLLPIRINHLSAYLDGARWYQILLDGNEQTDAFGDYKWNPVTSYYEPAETTVSVVAGKRVYPVRSIAELRQWYHADDGGYIASSSYPDGMHRIEVVFWDAGGTSSFTSGQHPLMFDNGKCTASLDLPLLNGTTLASDMCGVLYYHSKTADHCLLTYTATKPNGNSSFSYSVTRGTTPLPALSVQGTAPNAPASVNPTLADLLGDCTIAGFVENLSVLTTAINGVNRQSQYDASAQRAFCLAPS
jgi:hypothetical protein